jgi:hypothetical protein
MRSGDLQIHSHRVDGFISGVNEALGFVGLGGAEAQPPLGVGVETVIGFAASALNQAITLHNG